MNIGCLLFLKIVEKNTRCTPTTVNIHADIDTKIINIEKIRGIESASESLRAAGLKCISIRPRNRVCLRLQSGSEVSSNYRGIQPIVTRFPPENCVRLSEADRMRKEGGKNMEKRQRGRKREIDKEGDIARRGVEQKKRFRRLPATETPRNRRR